MENIKTIEAQKEKYLNEVLENTFLGSESFYGEHNEKYCKIGGVFKNENLETGISTLNIENFKLALERFKIKDDFIKYIKILEDGDIETAKMIGEEINARAATDLEEISSITISIPGLCSIVVLAGKADEDGKANLSGIMVNTEL